MVEEAGSCSSCAAAWSAAESNAADPLTWRRMVAATASGAFARCFVHPFDTMRVMSQLHLEHNLSLRGTFQKEWRARGVPGLYRGFPISLGLSAPAQCLWMSSYEVCKAYLVGKGYSEDSAMVHVAGGMAAEGVSSVFWTPMDILKQRRQGDPLSRRYKNSFDLIQKTYTKEGLYGFYRAYWLTLSVFMPYTVTYFVSYEKIKGAVSRLVGASNDGELGTFWITTSAAAAGACAASITTPLDVVKTRIQVADYKITFKEAFSALREEAAVYSWRVFTKGMLARVLWISPSVSLTFMSMDIFKRMLGVYDE